IDGDSPDVVAPKTQQLEGLPDAAMPFDGHVGHGPTRQVLHALLTNTGQLDMAGHRQPCQNRHRPPTDQQTHASTWREPNQPLEPLQDLSLDVDGGMVASGTAWVHGGGEGFGKHADDRRWRVHPTEEPGMAVTERESSHLRSKLIEHGIHTFTLL